VSHQWLTKLTCLALLLKLKLWRILLLHRVRPFSSPGDQAKISGKDAVRYAVSTPRDLPADDQVLASRLALLSKIFAVDDALLYSSVRRAIEDRYPRYRHHAGLSPLLASVADITPGGNMIKVIGRWFVARLLTPRNER
jgi:hypothetical protein